MAKTLQEKIEYIINIEKHIEGLLKVEKKNKKVLKKGVYVGKGVKTEPYVFFDTRDGEILIGENTKIKSHAILRGPLVIGKNCTINSFAEISHSIIGDVCKIGGEVAECVIQSYTNKQHYGFLGHSYIGSWVNIGAGTSVSDLKNTYSPVTVAGIETRTIFMGVIMGDYVKTAINTSIFGGKVIGASAHLYGTVTHDVPAFTSHVSAGNMYELPFDIAVKIQRAMMQRRGIKFSEVDQINFEILFKQTEVDRKKLKVKKSKLSFIS
jgi:UDP-N-acetylglucosamine diphosphorylase/glucosamine-1-phosphate N-acetyltransferase